MTADLAGGDFTVSGDFGDVVTDVDVGVAVGEGVDCACAANEQLKIRMRSSSPFINSPASLLPKSVQGVRVTWQ